MVKVRIIAWYTCSAYLHIFPVVQSGYLETHLSGAANRDSVASGREHQELFL